MISGSAAYHFSIQAFDENHNVSPLSNIASATTAFVQDSSTDPTLVASLVVVIGVLAVVVIILAVIVHKRRVGMKDFEKDRNKVMKERF